jgi:hypothetical protein
MLDQLMFDSASNLEAEFYKEKFYFSYSSLKKLLWNPAVFYQLYVLNIRNKGLDSDLINGKVIHALLLEGGKFNENFIISPSELPSGNSKVVIDRVYNHYKILVTDSAETRTNLEEFGNAILDVLADMKLHQSLKTDEQRLAKIITPDNISYFEFLKEKKDKVLIDQETYNYCKAAVDVVKATPDICNLIGCATTDFDNKEVYNELELQVDIKGKKFGLKGIIDNLLIDHDTKVIYINDIKTTSKELKDFKETVNFYSYWLQAVIYCTMVAIKFKDLLDNGYDIKFSFVVIDKNFNTYAFPVTSPTLENWFNKLTEVLDIASWHYENKNYGLPYEFAKGLVTL